MRARLRRLSPLTLATTVAAVTMLLFGAALTVAIIALANSHTATNEGKSAARQAQAAAARAEAVANCVNNVLGERGKVNDTPALIKEARAEAAWGRAIVAVIAVPKDATPHQRATATKAFVVAVNTYANDLASVYRKLARHQAERAKHPLGQC